MGLTTNFKWPYPERGGKVTDGSKAISDLAAAIDASVRTVDLKATTTETTMTAINSLPVAYVPKLSGMTVGKATAKGSYVKVGSVITVNVLVGLAEDSAWLADNYPAVSLPFPCVDRANAPATYGSSYWRRCSNFHINKGSGTFAAIMAAKEGHMWEVTPTAGGWEKPYGWLTVTATYLCTA